MNDQPPCLGRPGFLRPKDASGWQVLPATIAAKALCQDRCPRDIFLACARSALTAGTCFEEEETRVADGVVMAGIVCRGDALTERALRRVIKQLAQAPTTRPNQCRNCHKPMTTRRRKLVGHVVHEGGGMCTGCRRAQQRSA
ncbi:hypothetical protein [Rhodococcus sp. SGAir0479]|uniref:hypothetical protein n=1 Tax=Rhodococcus sp. SGAir0479 TaxID=2567884 RepID=UPI0010CCD1EC|nr:hypothetical protein [Rhodococcus sp. SGAir0479]QCQ89972.1 hypothetical protein E7742_01290 [Rhodococcus sp. SGAir0479]